MPLLPVAWGEVFDKLTILEIKQARLTSPAQQAHVAREHAELLACAGDLARFPPALAAAVAELKAINDTLWDIENGKRDCERRQCFDAHFIRLARDVYLYNDQRAAIKRRINDLLGSTLVEQKSHSGC